MTPETQRLLYAPDWRGMALGAVARGVRGASIPPPAAPVDVSLGAWIVLFGAGAVGTTLLLTYFRRKT